MTVAFQRMFRILERWNNNQVTPSLSKPHELSYRSNTCQPTKTILLTTFQDESTLGHTLDDSYYLRGYLFFSLENTALLAENLEPTRLYHLTWKLLVSNDISAIDG